MARKKMPDDKAEYDRLREGARPGFLGGLVAEDPTALELPGKFPAACFAERESLYVLCLDVIRGVPDHVPEDGYGPVAVVTLNPVDDLVRSEVARQPTPPDLPGRLAWLSRRDLPHLVVRATPEEAEQLGGWVRRWSAAHARWQMGLPEPPVRLISHHSVIPTLNGELTSLGDRWRNATNLHTEKNGWW